MWKEILVSKYDLDSGRSQPLLKYQLWWWKDLSKVWNKGEGDEWFQEALEWRVGCGDKVRFCGDVWVSRNSLSTPYPRLYFLSVDQGLMVSEVGEWEDSV